METASFYKKSLLVPVLGALFLTGCFAVYTDSPEKYGVAFEKEMYTAPGNFHQVFVQAADNGWESEIEAVVFDFKDDNFIVEPWNDKWRAVTSNNDLETIMADFESTPARAITVKPCDDCEREAAGLIFSEKNIVFKYERESGIVSFFKGTQSSTDFSGGGAAGSAGG